MQSVPLGELIVSFDHMRVPVATAKRVPGPFPYYGASGIVDYVDDHLFDGEYLLISEDGENLRSRSAPIAFLARGKFWVNNHAHVVQGKPGVADTRYLAYALSCTDISGALSGSAQPKLSKASMNRLLVPCFKIGGQRAIAEVLGALDDKISSNRAAASKADLLVRAMYRRLPVEHLRLDSVCWNPRSTTLPGPDSLCYVGLEHVPRRRMWLDEYGVSDDVTSAKSEFLAGDVLFGKLRPYFHKVVSAPVGGLCSTDILVLRPYEKEMGGLVLAAAASDETVGEMTAKSAGTKMPRASWADLSSCLVRGADDSFTREISCQILDIRNFVENMVRETRTLAQLRDTLLPALMDGRLRVKDAVAQAEEVL